MTFSVHDIPKAELHVHIEGTVTPTIAAELAARHGRALPETLLDEKGNYKYETFFECVTKTYDTVMENIRTEQDYFDITYAYLKQLHEQNTLYCEMMLVPDLTESLTGMSYGALVDCVGDAINKAREDFGIEARMQLNAVRHRGVEPAIRELDYFTKNPHPLLTGYNIAGGEQEDDILQFDKCFKRAHDEAGLRLSAHAGEANGPTNVWHTLNAIPDLERIGHGVRSIEDPALIEEIIKRDIVLEVCPNSNKALGFYKDFSEHPLRKLKDAGVKVTINSDDPPFFFTTLSDDYQVAVDHFDFTRDELIECTRTSLQYAFVDEDTRQSLLARLDEKAAKAA